MSENTQYINKWEGYYLDDCDCSLCLHFRKRNCINDKCCCEDEKHDAIESGRIFRKKRI